MTHLLVGDSDCTFQELVLIFHEPSICTLKIKWWTELAMRLDIPLDSVKKLQQDLRLDKLTYIDVIVELLTQWRMLKSYHATLGALYEAIPNEQKQIKDFLQTKIRKKANCWKELDEDSQNIILETNVVFLGRNYSLSTLKEMIKRDKFNDILNKPEMKDLFLKSFNKEDWDFGEYQIPKPLPYYVHRKLTIRRKLKQDIFQHKCSDIFVFEGIQHYHLSNLARPELTDISSQQIKKVTRRFILLEHPNDYDEIIKIAKYPVHRIKYENSEFFWISTSGSCQIIRIFLTNDVEEIKEASLVTDHLSNFNNRPIAICSSPGMGKSVLLASLESQIRKCYPKRITIYLQLRHLIHELFSIGPELNSENLKQILISSPTISSIGKVSLLELLHNTDLIFEIFLDGFDEISLENLQPVKHFLKLLLEFTNMRLYMTSRPHMQNEIENTLELISLDISPFNPKNQLNFLCDFWKLDMNITNHDKLSEFALTVLKSLELINEGLITEVEFAGIPLQCFLLAQVYGNDAKKYSNRDHFYFKATNSLYDLFNEFIKLKFQNIAECDRCLVKMYHWKEAIMLLFPDNQVANQIVQELTKRKETEEIPWDKIFNVGILEHASDKPNFVHRTFAEYLLAEFIVKEILTNQPIKINISIKFITDSVLSVYETTKGRIVSEKGVENMIKLIESSEISLTRKHCKELKTILLSQCNLPLHGLSNNLFQILNKWIYEMGSNAKVEILYSALDFLGYSKLIDDLRTNIFPGSYTLQHGMLCAFIEAALKHSEQLLPLKNYETCDRCVPLSRDINQVKWRLFTCVKLGYQFLTQSLVELYCKIYRLNEWLEIDPEIRNSLLEYATVNDNVELFKYICDTVKPYMELDSLPYQRATLFESIKRGNYSLVEYLIGNFSDVKENSEIFLNIFVNSWKDSQNVIMNKVKILELLKSLHYSFPINTLPEYFASGVNLTLLKTQYELFDFASTELDADFMALSVTICCRNDEEMDNLVNWLLSKDLTYLLTQKLNFYSCLLNQALVRNVLKAETLSKIYKKEYFDLGIIFNYAVVCDRSEDIFKMIVELSGDVNLVDEKNNTLLHWAAYFRKINLVSYLLSVGAKVNMKNRWEMTPLHNVFRDIDFLENFHVVHDIVQLLVTKGADVNSRNKACLSVIRLAKAPYNIGTIEKKTLDLLENVPNNRNDDECLINVFKISTDVLKTNIDPNLLFFMCVSSVCCDCFFAFVWNVVEICENVNKIFAKNTTLLHHAALFGKYESIEYLLTNGANPNLKDDDGDTPLHYIFDWDTRNIFLNSLNIKTQWIHDCVELLLNHYADVNTQNMKGETPLDRAQQQKDKLSIEDRTINLLNERFQNENEID